MSSFVAEKVDRFQGEEPTDDGPLSEARLPAQNDPFLNFSRSGRLEGPIEHLGRTGQTIFRQSPFGARPHWLARCPTGSVRPAGHARSLVALPPLVQETLELSEYVPVQDKPPSQMP